MRVTITGATGHIGKPLTERLLARGVTVRAVGRSAQKLAPLGEKGAEPCVGNMLDVAFLHDAFRGADAVFAMIPPNITAVDFQGYLDRVATNLAEALAAAGVKRAVALSSAGADLSSGTGPIAALHRFENRLRSVRELTLGVLRPTYFMENHLALIPVIKNTGMNQSAAHPDVPIAMIATRDIVPVAEAYLTADAIEGPAMSELLGPRDYTFREVTSVLGAAIGKPDLRYAALSDDQFRKGLMHAGASATVADVYVEMYEAFNEGTIQKSTRRTESNTTRTTLEEFARDVFAPAFQAA